MEAKCGCVPNMYPLQMARSGLWSFGIKFRCSVRNLLHLFHSGQNFYHRCTTSNPGQRGTSTSKRSSKLDCIPDLDKNFPTFLCLWAIASKLYYFVPENRFSVSLTMCICWAMAQARCPGRVSKSVSQVKQSACIVEEVLSRTEIAQRWSCVDHWSVALLSRPLAQVFG